MIMRNLLIVSIALSSVQGYSVHFYERVFETCENSVISNYNSTDLIRCGQLCGIHHPPCSGYCFSEANSSCTLHQIVDMGAGTVELGFRTYKYFADAKNSNDGFYHCIGLGAIMALPKNLEQSNYLLQLSHGTVIFLSADDYGTEGFWYTSGDPILHGGDKALIYSKWRSGEPNGGTNENCAVLSSNGWDDSSCAAVRPRVCQAPRPEICQTLPNPSYPDLRCYKRKV